MDNNKIQIAIDGPASAGKSTVAKLIAAKLAYVYCDTGAMYRAVTLKAMRHHIALDDEENIVKMLNDTDITFKPGKDHQHVFIDDREVTTDIRQEDVTNSVSTVSAISQVRKILVQRQKDIAKNGGVVMDGRDIGTVVLPQAEVKIFLIASVFERANRRFKDNAEKDIHVPMDKLEREIKERDYKDSHRKISPLTKADDAVELDTTQLSIDQVVNNIIKIAKQKLI